MDAKALAKSKRAHSLHHSKKHHPSPTSKTAKDPITASSGKKPNIKAQKLKTPQSHGSRSLPTNWDRYEDEYDSGSDDVSHNRKSQAPDVTVPKSKGADYAHLISEAKAQSQSQSRYSAESFTLFDDILDEFNQGLGPLLSARGQHIASSGADDNFLLDHKEASSHEAPFLSLNLHCLAEQLEKTSLAERLFIEPDLMPLELCIELQANTGEKPGQPASGTEATEGVLDGLASNIISEKNTKIHQSHEYVSPDSHRSSCSSGRTSTSEVFLDHDVDSLWELDAAGSNTSGKLTSDLTARSISERSLKFDAGAAEAELDLLLDTLSETMFSDSSAREQSSHTSQSTSASKHVKEDNAKNSGMVAANLDDDIDDLLNETTNLINQKRSPLHEAKASFGAPSIPDSNSKVLDDFDSWLDTM